MDSRDKTIIGLILAALALLVFFDWRRGLNIPAIAGVTGVDATPSEIGPASAWANVPTMRLMLPPGLGGYIVPNPAAAPVDGAGMYNCKACS